MKQNNNKLNRLSWSLYWGASVVCRTQQIIEHFLNWSQPAASPNSWNENVEQTHQLVRVLCLHGAAACQYECARLVSLREFVKPRARQLKFNAKLKLKLMLLWLPWYIVNTAEQWMDGHKRTYTLDYIVLGLILIQESCSRTIQTSDSLHTGIHRCT